MIELKDDGLVFSFPGVHPSARLTIDFQRTLRIPDDNKRYPLPPGLGSFPLQHVDDFSEQVPETWRAHGGVMLPMYQSEALWIYFRAGYVARRGVYPFAIKIAAGKINAVSGKAWMKPLSRAQQDYVVAPEQPWLDGFCVGKGMIRQFVAMPMGAGVTAEEQLTRKGEHGGLQIMACPMKRDVFEKRFPIIEEAYGVRFSVAQPAPVCCETPDMGLAPGGRMKQEIYEDPFSLKDWDVAGASRCFVHICNSQVWRQITGDNPPTVPPTAKEYSQAGLPWFEYYADGAKPIPGAKLLKKLKSVAGFKKPKGALLPENEAVKTGKVIRLGAHGKTGQVREWRA